MAETQKLVSYATSSADNLQQAKAGAESAIRGFYGEVGWNVEVRWAEASGPMAGTQAR